MMKKNSLSPKPNVSGSLLGNPAFWVALALLLISLGHALWAFSIGWNNTLNDHHSFRQSQTAITAYYLKGQPFHPDYETPVLGKPWSVPMEMPFYQLAAARLSSISGIPLDQAGRGVASACFLLTLVPLYVLLREFRVGESQALLVLTLLLTSPFYLFWSRAFLIESSVLLLCFAYLAWAVVAVRKETMLPLLMAMLFGMAAGLAKVTTWLPFLLAAFLWIVRGLLKWPPSLTAETIRSRLLPLILACGVPFVSAVAWVKYMDFHKALNPMAFNSPAFSTAWNFGTLAQKVSLDVWLGILARVHTLFGLPLPGFLILSAASAIFLLLRRRRKEAVVLLCFFLLYPLIFTNLHFIHDYYMYANGIFLALFAGMAVVTLWESENLRLKTCGWVLFLFMFWSGFDGYSAMYRPLQATPNQEIRELASAIHEKTSPEEVILLLGFDWSPLVPYYAERRALMIPDWTTLTEDQVKQALRNLKGEKVGMLLEMEPHRYPLERLLQQAEAEGIKPQVYRVSGFPQR
jgi:hypothetical protein